jgi:uncharacterized membrane protein
MELLTATGILLLLPLVILKLAPKIKIIEWLSPVVCCYALGILLGNVMGKGSWFLNGEVSKTTSEVSVLLALPLLLFSCDLLGWFKLARTTIISFLIVVFSVGTMSFLMGSLFKGDHPEVWKMAGMMVGVYTGGTPNLMAIGRALEVGETSFILINTVDVVLGGFYLLFIMSIGVKLLTRVLPAFVHSGVEETVADVINWQKFSFGKKFLHGIILFLLSGSSVGLALLLSHGITGTESVGIIILGLTCMALALSFIPKIRHFEGAQEIGQYLLLVFCVAVGSLANVSDLVSGSLWYFIFCGSIMFSSIFLHFLCCFIFKIDRDTAIITSMAGIFGPAFVAPMSQVLKNKSMLVSGVTTGLVGYAAGNFIGLFVAYLLK